MNEIKIITMEASEFEARLQSAVARAIAEYFSNGFPTPYNTQGEDDLIGTAEACKILGCSSRTMQNYRDQKLFSVIMRGPHKALYHRSEILAFRDTHLVKAK